MTHPVIERRRAEQREKIACVDRYIRTLKLRLPIEGAWVVGSVARGDFNVWSDIDVVVVAPGLPLQLLARADLFHDKPPGLQIVAYTPQEFDAALEKKNPLTIEATTVGVELAQSGEKPPDKWAADS
jgi:predicted nucleotidyltransferase